MTARWARWGAARADDGWRCARRSVRRLTDAVRRETRARTDRSTARVIDSTDRRCAGGMDARARESRGRRSSCVGRRSVVRSIGFTSVSNRSVDRFHIGFTLVSNRACGRWVSHRGGVYTKGARRDARAKTGTRELASTHWTRDRVRRRVVDPRTYARDGAASERVDENRSRVASRIRTARVDEERRRNGTTSRLGALGDANSAFGPFV